MSFNERLHERMRRLGTRVCLGLDPRPTAHPSTHPDRHQDDPAKTARSVVEYLTRVLDACDDLIACAKPQSAFFEAMGIPGMIAMAQMLAELRARDIPVLLDAKRGDIGSTAEAYAHAYLADGVFSADALTVNPYLGLETLEPFLEAAGQRRRSVFVVLKTSNPGSGDLQDRRLEDGRKLHEALADDLSLRAATLPRDADGYTALGAVVGATYPREVAGLRQRLPHSVLLVPGYGQQGGRGAHAAAAFDLNGLGAVVSSSRGLLYPTEAADEGADVGRASRVAALAMRDDIEEALANRD